MHALYVLLPALAILAIAYRYYSAFLATKVWMLDDARKTPAHTKYDGANYYPTSKWVMFGHHFAAITGAGPLVGPMLAAQFGYAPGFIWLVAGCCLAGRGPRLDGPVGLHPPRRQVAARHRQGGDQPVHRLRRRDRDPLHPRDRAGGPRHRIRQRAGRQRLGHVHRRHDHSARHVHGLLDVRVAQGQDHRSHRHRRVGTALRAVGRRADQPFRLVVREPVPSVAHADRDRAGRLRLRGVDAAGVAAAVAARLPQLLHQDRHHLPARGGRDHRQPRAEDAGAERVCRRRRADHPGPAVPVLLHHHRVRRHLRASTR